MYEENNNADDEFDPEHDASEQNEQGSQLSDLTPEDLALLDLHMQRWYGEDQDISIPLSERRQHALDEIPDLMETLRENAREQSSEEPEAKNPEADEPEDDSLSQFQYIRGYGPGAEQQDVTWDKLSVEDLAILDEYVNTVETDDAPLEERRTRVLENVKGIMDILRSLHEKDPTRDPMLEETEEGWAHEKNRLSKPAPRTGWEQLSDAERAVGKEMLEKMQNAGLFTDPKNRPLPFEEAMEQMLSDYPGTVQEEARERRIISSLDLEKPKTQGLTQTHVIDKILDPRRTMGPCTP